MEKWLLHWPDACEALPWPYDLDWRAVVASPAPLANPLDDFGLVSMCDGPSEMSNVPGRLPRGCPAGQYRLAIHHDAEALYVLATAVDGPPVATLEEAALRAGPLADPPAQLQLILADNDGIHAHSYTRAASGQFSTGIVVAAYGPRQPQPLPGPPPAEFTEAIVDGVFRCAWRIPLASLAPLRDGSRLRAGLAWMSLTSLELAVWGSAGSWGFRRDELVTVRLVDAPREAIWPECRRVELDYDPVTEQGSFRLHWHAPFGPDEAVDRGRHKHRQLHSHLGELRLNGVAHVHDLREQAETPPLPIADGLNEVHVHCAGSHSVRFTLEKRTGNRIAPCPYPPAPLPERDEFQRRWQIELDREVAELQARQAGGGLDLLMWPLSRAAAAGRYSHHVGRSEDALAVLRDLADRALALQRPDGTFSGYHLGRTYASGEAPPWSGGAYDSGQAGELWAVAAWLLGDDKYLDASRRLVAAYDQYRIEFNQNFAAFTLFHLVTHYRLTGDPQALDKARYYCRHLVATKLLPLGYQGGHNYYTVYGFITLRGMAMLCQVLPADDPYRPVLRELCLRMANQYISRLQPDGTVDTRDRYFVAERMWSPGLCSVAFLVDGDDLRHLDDAIRHTLQAPPESHRCRWLDSDLIRYLACRDQLLAGATPDPKTLI